MKCKFHPEEDALVSCQKNGFGFCRNCCEVTEKGLGCSCSSPDIYCKFRQGCMISYKEKEYKRGLEESKA